MSDKPHRTIEVAFIEEVGPVTAAELLAMPEDRWGFLRDQITDRHNGNDGLIGFCAACEGAVFIRTRARNNHRLPLFSHYSGTDPNCPWYQGRNTSPDEARKFQYQGKQESKFHRQMCELIAELAALDKRHVKHTVSEYLEPNEGAHGRYPDVCIDWEEFGTFVVEFQLSGTFQTEISARCKHYEREGIPILWVLTGINQNSELQQSFRDVIRRHRNNAFVLDQNAIAESRRQSTLVLTCYLRSGDVFDLPKLVRFDELTFPNSKLPYYEDRIVGTILADANLRRRAWIAELDSWSPYEQLLG